jgi:COP9 signalosome complex subunit 5
MQMHGQSGVEKGIKANGKPVEVMGLLLGRPDTEDSRALVISDAQALPIEGFETSVLADNDEVIQVLFPCLYFYGPTNFHVLILYNFLGQNST